MSEETALAVDSHVVQDDLFAKHVELKPDRLKWLKDPDLESWSTITSQLIENARDSFEKHKTSLFQLGDAFVYGEDHFGEEIWQIVDSTHYEEKTIQNAMWVCRQIKPKDRVLSLTFSHHEAVAKLEEGDRGKVLKEAAEGHLNVKETREKAREVKAQYPDDGKKKKAKAQKKKALVTEATDENSALHGMDVALTFIRENESKEAPLREWSKDRRTAWSNRLAEFRKIQRRMMGQN
jgi:hypothetical protein